MQENYNDFINKIRDKKILFCGLGRSNLPFINMLTSENIPVIAYDSKSPENIDKSIIDDLKSNSLVSLRAGDESVFNENIDILIRTPGMNFLSEKIIKLKNCGTVITSEMEIFFDIFPGKIIGITGSDGKTTVSTLIYEMLKAQGLDVFLGGNIGKPLLPQIKKMNKNSIAVIELSSFQLISMRKSPEIAVITNISPNHLDVHKNMEEYIFAKKQIIKHQNAFSKAIINFDNEITRNFENIVRGQKVFFSRTSKNINGVWIDDDDNVIYSSNDKNEKIVNVSEIKIAGEHNKENFLTAIGAVYGIVSAENIKKIANTFNGVEHRIEFVRELNGVRFYNDSIASSPTRTISGTLSLFEQKIILIAGGYDKKIPFEELAKKITQKVSILILMGHTADKIEEQVKKIDINNYIYIFKVNCMEDAVKKAFELSKPKDIVVLSPACASFDLYKNFEERGKDFKNIVNKL